MQLQTFSFQPDRGWSVSGFPALDSEQTLVMVYGAPSYIDHPAPITELAKAYPRSILVGCSSAGEISGGMVHDETLSVSVTRFEHTRLALVSTSIDKTDSHDGGVRLAQQLNPDGLCGVLVLTEGVSINGSELAQGISSVLSPEVIVTGGLAGDGRRFEHTWVIRAGRPENRAATAVGFYGKRLHIGHGSSGGWEGFGPERRVTRSHGNVLYELDGKPALALYKEYLGEHAAQLPGSALFFPLSIWNPEPGSRKLVRCISAVDEATQSITFSGDIPIGQCARLTRANFENLVSAASEASDLLQGDRAAPVLALAVSCVGRRMVLGERTDQELEITLSNLPPGSQQVGFYSYGEIAPFPGQACALYNQTMTLTTFCEY